MTDPAMLMTSASAGLIGLGIMSAASLRAWNGWLDLKRLEVDGQPRGRSMTGAGRPELAELRERVRKLEALANGIDI